MIELVKPLTRFVAWIYILCELPAMLFVALLVLCGGVVAAGALDALSSDCEWLTRLAGLGVVTVAGVLAGALLLQVLPWIFLLKKRAWAWWLLTVVFALTTVVSLIPLGTQPLKQELREGLGLAVVPALTLIVLLLDRPDSWTSPRKKRRRLRSRGRRSAYARRR